MPHTTTPTTAPATTPTTTVATTRRLPLTTWLAAAGLAAWACAPAHAFSISNVVSGGNTVDTGFSTSTGLAAARMLSLDLGVFNTAPISLSLAFDAGDPALLPFNALLSNLVGLGFEQINLSLAGASFALPLGSAAGSGFGGVASVSGDTGNVRISFSSPENFAATVGDWFLNGAGQDFGILTTAGGTATLTMTSAVPEPGSLALWLAGVAGVVGACRRTRIR